MERYRRLSDSLDMMKREGLQVDELKFQHRYLNNMKEFIETQKNIVKEIARQVESKRIELVNATIDRKVIDKARERKEQEYKKNIDRDEQKLTDEVAVNGFIRRDRR